MRCPWCPAAVAVGSFLWESGLSPGEGLPGGVPPWGHGGSLRDGGGVLSGGSRGGGCLKTDDSEWPLWEDFSSEECLDEGKERMEKRSFQCSFFNPFRKYNL